MKFIVARYYFDSLFRDVANKDFLSDLKKDPIIDEDLFIYALGDFQTEHIKEYSFLRGTFGKIIKLESSKIYNKEKQEFIDDQMNDKVLATIEFLIHHESHLIFIEKSSKIEHETFKNKLIRIYEQNSIHPAAFKIDFVSDEKDIYKTLKTWDVVSNAVFKNLRPSNPDCNDTFKNIEELIKETKSNTANLALKNDTKNINGTEGLNIDSMLIKEALSLSAHGYGEAKLEGMKEGEQVQVETKRTVRKVEINFNEDGALENIIKIIEEVQQYEKK